jgi:hypothetical protein
VDNETDADSSRGFVTAILVHMRAVEMEAVFQFHIYFALQFKFTRMVVLLKCIYIYLIHVCLVRINIVLYHNYHSSVKNFRL